jgi:hypothetical protein
MAPGKGFEPRFTSKARLSTVINIISQASSSAGFEPNGSKPTQPKSLELIVWVASALEGIKYLS